MDPLFLNNTLRIPCPEGFHVMDDQERKTLRFITEGPGVCLSCPERHIIISIGYKQTGGFTAMLVSGKDALKGMESQIRASMGSYGYQLDGFAARLIGTKNGEGIGFHYTARDIGMYSESFVIKEKKTFYYFHYYTRETLIDENFPVWKSFLDEIRWEGDQR